MSRIVIPLVIFRPARHPLDISRMLDIDIIGHPHDPHGKARLPRPCAAACPTRTWLGSAMAITVSSPHSSFGLSGHCRTGAGAPTPPSRSLSARLARAGYVTTGPKAQEAQVRPSRRNHAMPTHTTRARSGPLTLDTLHSYALRAFRISCMAFAAHHESQLEFHVDTGNRASRSGTWRPCPPRPPRGTVPRL